MSKENDPYMHLREKMIREQIAARNISDDRLLQAFREVPRHVFVPKDLRDRAYTDHALPLGPEQTISQPYMVAVMIDCLDLDPSDRVLEIGTGSGYQAALLSKLTPEVYTIEIDHDLSAQAQHSLQECGISSVHCKQGDGFAGWKEHAPYDAILVSAAPSHIPRNLVAQLKDPGGRMVLPLDKEADHQELVLLRRTTSGLESNELGSVRFVPMKNPENQQ